MLPKHIWNTPYYKLKWRYRWFVQPLVMLIKGLNWLVIKIVKMASK
ncbi:hypothetical protein [Orenia marismortui]|nr:hypothetical protein [Orenia marismortui]